MLKNKRIVIFTRLFKNTGGHRERTNAETENQARFLRHFRHFYDDRLRPFHVRSWYNTRARQFSSRKLPAIWSVSSPAMHGSFWT